MDSIRVKYEGGVFKPLRKPRKLKEGAIGEVHVEGTRKRPSVRSSECFGLWKNRKDNHRRDLFRAKPSQQASVLGWQTF